MFSWLRHAFGGGTPAPPIPARSPVKHPASAPTPKPAPEKRTDTPTGENVQDRFILRKVSAIINIAVYAGMVYDSIC